MVFAAERNESGNSSSWSVSINVDVVFKNWFHINIIRFPYSYFVVHMHILIIF